jgi:AcrR family transcriptional regulator
MVKPGEENETRNRILGATNELFRRQGFNGTSLSQVVKVSGATTGSVYHFFPGGKTELAAEVLRTSGQVYQELVEMIVDDADDVAIAMTDAFGGAAAVLVESNFIDPCPIGTVAREVASTHDDLRVVAQEVMASWVGSLAVRFRDAGIAADRADALANLVVASIEGGFVMARTARNAEAFASIGEMLREVVAAELARVGAR